MAGGEDCIRPMVAATTNAVYNANGLRMHELPMSPPVMANAPQGNGLKWAREVRRLEAYPAYLMNNEARSCWCGPK